MIALLSGDEPLSIHLWRSGAAIAPAESGHAHPSHASDGTDAYTLAPA